MFNCHNCGQTVGPKVKPVMVIIGTRQVAYTNMRTYLDEYEREHKEEVRSIGTEITREVQVCPPCDVDYIAPIATQKLIRVNARGFEETMPEPLRTPLVRHALYNALERYEKHGTKRAKRDSGAAIPIVKDFVDRNKEFIF